MSSVATVLTAITSAINTINSETGGLGYSSVRWPNTCVDSSSTMMAVSFVGVELIPISCGTAGKDLVKCKVVLTLKHAQDTGTYAMFANLEKLRTRFKHGKSFSDQTLAESIKITSFGMVGPQWDADYYVGHVEIGFSSEVNR